MHAAIAAKYTVLRLLAEDSEVTQRKASAAVMLKDANSANHGH